MVPPRSSFRFLVFSDLHAHAHKKFSTVGEITHNSRLDVAAKVLRYLGKLSRETGIKDVIFSGDLFEAKGRVPVSVFNTVFLEIKNLQEEHNLNIIMIPGNHDFVTRNGKDHALKAFEMFKSVRVIGVPVSGYWPLSNGTQSVHITAVPFRESMEKSFFPKSNDKETPSVCVTHGLVRGSKLSDNDEFGSKVLKDQTEGLFPFRWLSSYDLSVVGHVHYPQIIGGEGPILVPGQPWHQFPHEQFQKRGIWEVELHPETFMPSYKMHIVPGIPRFVECQLSDNGGIVWDANRDKSAGNIVLMRPDSVYIPSRMIDAARDVLLKAGALYVDLLPLVFKKTGIDSSPRIALDPMLSPLDVLTKVLDEGEIDLKGFSREDIQRLGEDIIREALGK